MVTVSIGIRVANLMGEFSVLNELVIALICANPKNIQVIDLALQNSEKLRDHVINSELPDSWLAGLDLSLSNLRKLRAALLCEDSDKRSPSASNF